LMGEQIDRANAEGMEVVLDGYPRDEKQTEIMLADENSQFFDSVDVAVVLDVPKEELWKRIESRGREDDTKAAVEKRFAIFEENIGAILPLLEERNVPIIRVNGVGGYDEVTERIEKEIFRVLPATPEVFNNHDLDVIENDSVEKERSYGE